MSGTHSVEVVQLTTDVYRFHTIGGETLRLLFTRLLRTRRSLLFICKTLDLGYVKPMTAGSKSLNAVRHVLLNVQNFKTYTGPMDKLFAIDDRGAFRSPQPPEPASDKDDEGSPSGVNSTRKRTRGGDEEGDDSDDRSRSKIFKRTDGERKKEGRLTRPSRFKDTRINGMPGKRTRADDDRGDSSANRAGSRTTKDSSLVGPPKLETCFKVICVTTWFGPPKLETCFKVICVTKAIKSLRQAQPRDEANVRAEVYTQALATAVL